MLRPVSPPPYSDLAAGDVPVRTRRSDVPDVRRDGVDHVANEGFTSWCCSAQLPGVVYDKASEIGGPGMLGVVFDGAATSCLQDTTLEPGTSSFDALRASCGVPESPIRFGRYLGFYFYLFLLLSYPQHM